MDKQSFAGEYQLQGVREMASGFLLKPNGNFQFFFSYGALDRYGTGKWVLRNNEVVLNSAEKPEHDFALLESKVTDNNEITVQISDRNRNLLHYVYASLQNEEQESWQQANNDGLILFPQQEIKDISLLFEYCPEKISIFTDINKKHNHFIFRFEPWIVEVFFKDFVLKAGSDGLAGGHPLMKGDKFQYGKL